jgi:hypothetical protein
LHEGETFRALVVPVAYNLRVLHVSDAIEQFEQIALGGIERQVAHVEPRGRDLNPFWFTRRSRRLRSIARFRRRFLLLAAVSKEFGNALPESLLVRLYRFLGCPKAFLIASASAPTARAAWASSG